MVDVFRAVLPVHTESVGLQCPGRGDWQHGKHHADKDATAQWEVVPGAVQTRVDDAIHDRDEYDEEHHVKQRQPRRWDLKTAKWEFSDNLHSVWLWYHLISFLQQRIARPTACNLVNMRHGTKDILLVGLILFKMSIAVYLPYYTIPLIRLFNIGLLIHSLVTGAIFDATLQHQKCNRYCRYCVDKMYHWYNRVHTFLYLSHGGCE